MRMTSQVKIGMILSYCLMIFNAIYGFFMTPYVVGCLGDVEYGVYKTIGALASSVAVLDIGLGSMVMRYIAKYKSNKEDHKIPEFLGMSVIQSLIMCVILAIAVGCVYFTIRPTYSGTFTEQQIQKAQLLFTIYGINMLLHVWRELLMGIIKGHNRFIFANSMQIMFLVFRVGMTVILLQFYKDSLVIILLDTLLVSVFCFLYLFYIKKVLNESVRFGRFNIRLFFESGKYTLLSFLVSIAYQVGGNLDNVVIGALSGPALVTVYSMALLIYNMFQNLSMAVSNVLLPTVSQTIAEDDESNSRTIQLVINVGRIQLIILGAVLIGFFCLGKEFITIWLGDKYQDIYLITLILIIPSLFELCVNTCLAILRAKNKLFFFTITMFSMALINAIVTIIAVKNWSYIGAAIGTALSVILGNLIVMNIYYTKKHKLPMLKIYGRIFLGICPCLLLSGCVLMITSRLLNGNIWTFIANVCIFCIVYGFSLWHWGLNAEERKHVPILCKLENKKFK